MERETTFEWGSDPRIIATLSGTDYGNEISWVQYPDVIKI